jgi:uncharacterized protein YhjY with autotransporter beta-barrel domain
MESRTLSIRSLVRHRLSLYLVLVLVLCSRLASAQPYLQAQWHPDPQQNTLTFNESVGTTPGKLSVWVFGCQQSQLSGSMKVTIDAVPETASAGSDFIPVHQTFTITPSFFRAVPGDSYGELAVPFTILDDVVDEPNETLRLSWAVTEPNMLCAGEITVGYVQTGAFTTTIVDNDAAACNLTVSPSTLPPAHAGVQYTQAITASGVPPYTYSIVAGSLPPGLTFRSSNGTIPNATIDGTPTQAGTFAFTVEARDSGGDGGCTVRQNYTIEVTCANISISPGSLAQVSLGTPFETQLSAAGGTGPYTFAFVGPAPAGVTLSQAGLLSGTVNTAGTGTFTVRVTDAKGCTADRQYTLTSACPTIAITPDTLPKGSAGVPYAGIQFSANGGTAPYQFSLASGQTPGLSLSAGGALSGTPSTAGTYSLGVRATDSNGCSTTRTYSLEVGSLALTKQSGDGQRARVGQPLLNPLVVLLRDSEGKPRGGATIQWSVRKGGATLSASSSTTGSDGLASVNVTVGTVVGDIEIVASASFAESVVFTATADADLTEIPGLNPTQQNVAAAVNTTCESATQSDLIQLCKQLASLSDDAAKTALDEIAPDEVAAQGNTALETMGVQLGNIGSRLAALRGGASRISLEQLSLRIGSETIPGSIVNAVLGSNQRGGAAGPGPDRTGRLGVFVNGTIGSGERRTSESETGFDLDASSITAGVDYRFRDRLVGGIAIGRVASDSDLKEDGGSLESAGYTVSAYGLASGLGERTTGRSHRAFYIDGIVGTGRNDYDSVRNIDIPGQTRARAAGSTRATQFALGAGTGLELSTGAGLVEMFVRGNYSKAKLDGYEEKGAGALNLVIQDQDLDSLIASAGVDAGYSWSTSWGVVRPNLRVTALRELADDSRLITARFVQAPLSATFTVPTAAPDRNYFNVSAGLSVFFSRGVSAFLAYSKDTQRDDLTFQSFQFGLRFEL